LLKTCSHRRLVSHFAYQQNEECCFLFRTERIARAKKCLILLENSGHARWRFLLSDPRANHPLASSIRSNHFRAKRAILSRSAAKCLAAFVSLGSSYLCSSRRRLRVLIRTQIKTTAASSTANIKSAVSMAVRKKSKQRSFTLHGRTGIASLDNLRSKQVWRFARSSLLGGGSQKVAARASDAPVSCFRARQACPSALFKETATFVVGRELEQFGRLRRISRLEEPIDAKWSKGRDYLLFRPLIRHLVGRTRGIPAAEIEPQD
jgi:hypothetical protein